MAIYLMSVPEPAQTQNRHAQEERMTEQPENAIVTVSTKQSVEQTVQKLEDLLRAKGTKVFALEIRQLSAKSLRTLVNVVPSLPVSRLLSEACRCRR